MQLICGSNEQTQLFSKTIFRYCQMFLIFHPQSEKKQILQRPHWIHYQRTRASGSPWEPMAAGDGAKGAIARGGRVSGGQSTPPASKS